MKFSSLDDLDQKILRLVQQDADLGIEKIAELVGSSRTPVWNRLRKLKANGYIRRTVALLDAEKLGLLETFFVSIAPISIARNGSMLLQPSSKKALRYRSSPTHRRH